MKTVCAKDVCTGCMACIDRCSQNAISIQDDLKTCYAAIDETKCIECGMCYKVCPNTNPIIKAEPVKWYQGWTNDDYLRGQASSGGIASELARTFTTQGGVVCSCSFYNGEFRYHIAKTEKELEKFRGSKYVKSSPKGIYKEIQQLLKCNQKVLFIGLPCHAAGLKNYISGDLQQKLYTVDLICHGTPSPELLKIFLKQYRISLKNIKDIRFRRKANFQIFADGKGIITNGVTDRYSISFLNSLVYTENCYSCKYASKERVSDITLGDSWGSMLDEEEQKRGISLILCQTAKGEELLQNSNICLKKVDIENAVNHNQQLLQPSKNCVNRSKFFEELKKGKTFNQLVFKYLPMQCIKQDIKQMLIKLKIIHRD